MRHQVGVWACCLELLVLAVPTFAHHSFAATYDRSAPVKLDGVVTELHFKNPHIWVYLDVPGPAGPEQWKCEGVAPNQLYRLGWTKDTLKPGDRITIAGYRARNGSKTCDLGKVTFTDGRQIPAGQNDAAPAPARDR